MMFVKKKFLALRSIDIKADKKSIYHPTSTWELFVNYALYSIILTYLVMQLEESLRENKIKYQEFKKCDLVFVWGLYETFLFYIYKNIYETFHRLLL